MTARGYLIRRLGLTVTMVALAAAMLWQERLSLSEISIGWLIAWVTLGLAVYYVEAKKISLGPAGTFSPAPMLIYMTVIALGPWALLPIALLRTRFWETGWNKLIDAASCLVYAQAARMVFLFVRGMGQGEALLDTLLAHALAIGTFIGLNLLLVMLKRVTGGTRAAAIFWRTYYQPILPLYVDNMVHGAICLLLLERLGFVAVAFAIYIAYSKLMAQAHANGGASSAALSAEMLINTIDAKDAYTKAHSERVARYAMAIAQQLHLPQQVRSDINTASTLHDIGKIATPDAVLQKAGRLTDDEFRLIQGHSQKSQQILAANPQMTHIAEIIGQHHERYDGRGYPVGLSGEDIHIEARVIALADAFDAMTTDRPYRKALSIEEAIKELRANLGTQFDPEVVAAFLRHLGVSVHDPDEQRREQLGVLSESLARQSISQGDFN